jgi:hypothetical protein
MPMVMQRLAPRFTRGLPGSVGSAFAPLLSPPYAGWSRRQRERAISRRSRFFRGAVWTVLSDTDVGRVPTARPGVSHRAGRGIPVRASGRDQINVEERVTGVTCGQPAFSCAGVGCGVQSATPHPRLVQKPTCRGAKSTDGASDQLSHRANAGDRHPRRARLECFCRGWKTNEPSRRIEAAGTTDIECRWCEL